MSQRLDKILNNYYGDNFKGYVSVIEDELQNIIYSLQYNQTYEYYYLKASQYNLSVSGNTTELKARISTYLTSMLGLASINTTIQALSNIHKTRNIKYTASVATAKYSIITNPKQSAYKLIVKLMPLGVDTKIAYNSYLQVGGKHLTLNDNYITIIKSTE